MNIEYICKKHKKIDSSSCPAALRDASSAVTAPIGLPACDARPSTCGSVTGHGKAKRADRGTLQHAGAEAQGVAGVGLRRGAWRQNGCTPLRWAALSGSEAGVRALLECKADVEARDKVGSGRGFRLRICVREGGEGVPMRAVQERGKSAECAVARERSWISAA